MTNAKLLHLSDDHDEGDDVVDRTTAPDEWAFFPAHSTRTRARGRLKLIKTRDAGAVASAREDAEPHAEPAADEPVPADAPAVEEPAVGEPAVATSTADERSVEDVVDADEPSDDEPSDDEPVFVVTSVHHEPTADDEPSLEDEPVTEAEAFDDPAHMAEAASLVEPSVVDERSDESSPDPVAETTAAARSTRKSTQRKPSQRKPAARKTAGSRPSAADKRRKQDASTEADELETLKPARGHRDKTSAVTGRPAARPRPARRSKTGPVQAGTDTPAPVAATQEPAARRSNTKRILVSGLAVVLASLAAVGGYMFMRDDTPEAPATPVADVVSRYAQGDGGVTAGSQLGFRAVFPGAPVRDEIVLPGSDADTTIRYERLSFRSGGVEFEAGRIVYPDSVDLSNASLVIRKAADASARARHGKVAAYGKLKVDGDRAGASVVSSPDGSWLHTQAVLHGRTMYVVRVDSQERTQPAFDRFVDSFEIL